MTRQILARRHALAALSALVSALLSALALAGAAFAHGPSPAGQPTAKPTTTTPSAGTASQSIFQLGIPLTDQAGHAFTLADKRGTPMVVSMFYTSCQFVCPMLVDAIRATDKQLTDAERKRLNMLLVSFDPAHDTVDVLRKTATQRELDTTRWSLARADAKNVRKLAALLDIQYRALEGGEFNHSTVLILVDADGRIVGRTSELAGADPAFVRLVKATLATSASGAP
jgi:protein SCO1/2